MRALILIAGAALALSACSSNEAANNTMNVDENLMTDMNVTEENMATDMNATDMNAVNATDMNATTDMNAANTADMNATGNNAM